MWQGVGGGGGGGLNHCYPLVSPTCQVPAQLQWAHRLLPRPNPSTTLHPAPSAALKWVMAVFDVPEAIAVSRTAICSAGGGLASLTRLQAAGFYLGVLAYYW